MTFIRHIENDKQNLIILKKAIQIVNKEIENKTTEPFQIGRMILFLAGSLKFIARGDEVNDKSESISSIVSLIK